MRCLTLTLGDTSTLTKAFIHGSSEVVITMIILAFNSRSVCDQSLTGGPVTPGSRFGATSSLILTHHHHLSPLAARHDICREVKLKLPDETAVPQRRLHEQGAGVGLFQPLGLRNQENDVRQTLAT